MATTTTNMSLTAWDQVDDLFNHVELANNFTAIDEHDHTSGSGVQIPAGGLANNSVTTAAIQNSAVTGGKILDGTITAGKLAGGSVSASALALEAATYVPSADYTLTDTVADVPGLSHTFAGDGDFLVFANLSVTIAAASDGMLGYLHFAGATDANLAGTTFEGTSMVTQTWLLTGVNAADVAKIQAERITAAGTSTVNEGTASVPASTFTVLQIG